MIKFKRLLKSFKYAFRGLYKVLREEQNLRVQFFIAFIILLFAWYFHINSVELALLIFVISLVILMEIINSAVERISDILKPRINNYVKEIKDIMAAAVMFASVTAIVVGIIIFFPYIKALD
ncbi:diacylglycerol kinase family protein [Candidatus Parcubacteria bacterium]|nr:diacylglycerol kinase family protein [Candidatus Parcubacteria bacterium]